MCEHQEQEDLSGITYVNRNGQITTIYGIDKPKHGDKSHSHHHNKLRITIVGALLVLLVGLTFVVGLPVVRVIGAAHELTTSISHARLHVDARNYVALRQDFSQLSEQAGQLSEGLSDPFWSTVSLVPLFRSDVLNARTVAVIVQRLSQASDSLLAMLSTEENVDVGPLLTVVTELSPILDLSADEVAGLSHGKNEKLNSIVDSCQELMPIASAFTHMAGSDGPRKYLVVGQSNSEIRSTGGFAGAWGVVDVSDDRIELVNYEPGKSNPYYYDDVGHLYTDEEEAFLGRRVMGYSTSVNIVPDYSHVGSILTEYWRMSHNEETDGMVSVDPVFIQRLLGVLGGVTAEDGTVVDGENAADVLLHQAYSRRKEGSNENALFEEVVKLTFDKLTHELDAETLGNLLDVAREGAEQGRLLVWMKRAEEQNAMRALGVTGEVPSGINSPQLGVYLNDWGWSKMNWWLDLRTSVGKAVANADGSSSYNVTTTLRNAMTPEEAYDEPSYVHTHNIENASSPSAILDLVILLAPEGGSITDLAVDGEPVAEGWDAKWEQESHGSLYGKDAWQTVVDVPVQETVAITYTVTVPAEAKEPLQVHMTPTARSFEEQG